MLDTAEQYSPTLVVRTSHQIDPFYVRNFPVWKRGLDIVGALVGLVLVSPLLLAIWLYIRRVSPGPVIFRQNRVGTGGRRFEIYKFRTMHLNADATEHQQYLASLIKAEEGAEGGKAMVKLADKERIIPGGNLLRQSCIDEFPQLLNVLKGDMSLVGPRPPIPYEAVEYYRWHNGRFDCRPGMTGLWQVSGKNSLSFKQMVRLDIKYARKMSLWLDLKILFKTPYTILMQIMEMLIKKLSYPIEETHNV